MQVVREAEILQKVDHPKHHPVLEIPPRTILDGRWGHPASIADIFFFIALKPRVE